MASLFPLFVLSLLCCGLLLSDEPRFQDYAAGGVVLAGGVVPPTLLSIAGTARQSRIPMKNATAAAANSTVFMIRVLPFV